MSSSAVRHLQACLIVSLTVLVGITRLSPLAAGQPESPSLFVTPFVYVAGEDGEIFDMAVNVSSVGDLHSYSLAVVYDPALLDVVGVVQGDQFLDPASFEFTINELEGLVEVNASLPLGSTALWGDGTLTRISFRAAQPSAEDAQYSTIALNQTKIYNAGLELIDCCSLGGLYFWQSIQPGQTQEERLIDLFTQRGGEGPDASGGIFVRDELVYLTTYVTYNGWPQQNLLVSFQVIDPSGETIFVDIVETDEYGYATVTFRIPDLDTSLGLWTVVASVDVACTIVWDSTEFHVVPDLVGGISAAVETCEASAGPAVYIVTIMVLAVGFVGAQRKTRPHSF